ncbi:hypothetical protein [Thermococcus sp.]|uniref:hypothetical protein n=1 Tax=Thermococcus sp. TaxID=35749 RepID=UPI002621497C|nr:hypothetical protein [Thermococcus sp.]
MPEEGELFLKSRGIEEISGDTIRRAYLWPVEEMSGLSVGGGGRGWMTPSS